MTKKQSDLETYIRQRFPNAPVRRRVTSNTSGESMSHQSFAQESDINFIIKKWSESGLDPSRQSGAPQYGDFTEFVDYKDACDLVFAAQDEFMQLPSEIRDLFKNSPEELINFVTNPANEEQAISLGLLPQKHDNQGHQKGQKNSPPPSAEESSSKPLNNKEKSGDSQG